MKKTLITSAIALATVTTIVFAATAPNSDAPEGHRWHFGHGGPREIKIADAEAHAKEMFDKVDINHDGFVSQAEFNAAPRPRMMGNPMMGLPPMMRMMHRVHEMHDPGSAASSEAEGPAGATPGMHHPDPKVELPALFKRLDTNHDGNLTNDEFAQLPEAHQAQMRDHVFAMLDKDGDGKLSRDEFPPFVAHLKTLDKNGDGIVTNDEMPRHGDHDGPDSKP